MLACLPAWSAYPPGLSAFLSPSLWLVCSPFSPSLSVCLSPSLPVSFSLLSAQPAKVRVRRTRRMPGCNSALHLWSVLYRLVCLDTLLRDGKQIGIIVPGWSCFRFGSPFWDRVANPDSIVTFGRKTSDSEDDSSGNNSFFG